MSKPAKTRFVAFVAAMSALSNALGAISYPNRPRNTSPRTVAGRIFRVGRRLCGRWTGGFLRYIRDGFHIGQTKSLRNRRECDLGFFDGVLLP